MVSSFADAARWREKWAGNVRNPDDFVRFVDDVGCCTKLELPRYPGFPSQQQVIGDLDAGVPDLWFWKDDLHAEKRVYYTRLFHGQPGFISYHLLPAFIATNGAVADELMFEGVLTPEARQIHQTIDEHGPIPIRELKRMLTPDAKRSASRVLIELECQFLISKTGITGRTRGTYGYIWDLVERWIPDALSEADRLGRSQAADAIREHLRAFGIEPDSQFYEKVLGWSRA